MDSIKRGLAALAEVTHSSVDGATEQLWHQATRELSEDQWRYGLDVVIRTWTSTWMPPPAVVINAGFTMPVPPRENRERIRPDGEFWESEAQRDAVERIVRDNPKRPTEHPLSHIRRIAILSGLMKADAEGPEAKP